MTDKKRNFYKSMKSFFLNLSSKKDNNKIDYADSEKPRQLYQDIVIGVNDSNEIQKKTIANDSAFAQIYQDPFYVSTTNALLIDNVFMGYAEMANLSTNGLLRHIADTLAGDMTRKGFKVVNKNKELDKDEIKTSDENIKKMEAKFKQLKLNYNIKKTLINTFIYGGCMLYPEIDGAKENNNGTFEHENELFLDPIKIKQGSLKYLKVIEPMYTYPLKWVADDPTSYDYYNPVYYSVMGRTYHRSRLLKFIHMEAPDILKPTYTFYGIPLLQICIPYARDFEKIRGNVANIVERFNLSILGVDMEQITDIGSDTESDIRTGENLRNRVETFNIGRNNYNTFVIDKENESFQQIQIPLTSLDTLLDQAVGFLAMISKIPATKLLGDSPKGMNATGEHEMRNYYDAIRLLQENVLLDNLTTILHMVQLDLFGEVDENYTIEFENLWDANELEEAQIENTKANTLATLVNAEILSRNEALKQAIKSDKIDLSDVELPDDISSENYEDAYENGEKEN